MIFSKNSMLNNEKRKSRNIINQIKSLLTLTLFTFTPLFAQNDDYVKIGGAVRYNILVHDYESKQNANDAQFTWDTWRLNVTAKQSGILLDFEYRFYPTFDTHFIHHGWIGYDFTNNLQMQLGVTQVPFGNLKYASHSWWFVTPYYVGLEDDYDMGIKLLYNSGNWELAFAYFLQPEPAGPAPNDVSYGIGGSGRYSYDVIPSANQSNQEKHQGNIRGAYSLEHSREYISKLGISLQYGGIYNSIKDDMGNHFAIAAHLDGNYSRFNIKAQYNYHKYDITDDQGNSLDIVQMGAYGSGTYGVATEASMYTLGVSYGLPVELGPITKLTFYNDYTYTAKNKSDFYDTQQNTIGMMVTAGSVYTYIDMAMGKNQPWLTDNFGTGLGKGIKNAGWNTRFNINIGYYF